MSISKNELKKISSLNRKSKRKEYGLFIVEGEKNCKELIESDFEIEMILASSKSAPFFPGSIECSQKDLERLSNLKNSSDVIAVSKIPTEKEYITDDKPIIYLENINDPGNLGSIIRSLDWFTRVKMKRGSAASQASANIKSRINYFKEFDIVSNDIDDLELKNKTY